MRAAPRPTFRPAVRADLEAIVCLLAADPRSGGLERHVEGAVEPDYVRAFEAIAADPNNQLIVVSPLPGEPICAVYQLTYVPYLCNQGGWRALIDCVRIDPAHRSTEFGRSLLDDAVARARHKGCFVLQLTTDKARPQAKLFYERLGFVPSHDGMRLSLAA